MNGALEGWSAILAASEGPMREFRASLDDPDCSQRRLLACILSAAQGTSFAEEHGIAAETGVETFRRRVPIRGYADMEAYVARMASGEADVLFRGTPVAFERTGGSSGGAKLIPYNEGGLASFRNATLAWIGDLAARRPGIARGRAYLALSQPRSAEFTAGGTPIGMGSDAAYLGPDLAHAAADLVVAPVLEAGDDAVSWRATTAAALYDCENLAFISVWSPTFLLAVLDCLSSEFDAVALRLSPSARRRLEHALQTGDSLSRSLWPALECVSCWTDGASRPFAASLEQSLEGVAIEPKGLFSSEAVVTIPHGAGAGAPPALPWTFLEFLDEGGDVLMSHQLSVGARYFVVATTQGGLFRYDTGDMVECVAKAREVPRLMFAGRREATSDMVGEKLDDAFVVRALAQVGFPCVLVPRPLPRPRYDLLVECPPGHEADAAARAERALRANPQYAFARDFGQLLSVTPHCIASVATVLAQTAEKRGLRIADAKPSGILKIDLAQSIVIQAESLSPVGGDTGCAHENRTAVP